MPDAIIRAGSFVRQLKIYTIMLKKLLALLPALVLYCSPLFAQNPNLYVFEKRNVTYAELSNDTAVPGAFVNPTGIWALDNFTADTFELFNKKYVLNNVTQSIVFSNNGFIRIEDDSTFIVIDAAFTYADSIDATTKVSYVIDGTPGNKILKVQWKNLKLTNGPAGNFLNYQIWLYQKTGVFEIYYGPSSANNQSGYNISNGPNVGLFYSLTSFTEMFEKIWINGSPASYAIDSNRNNVFKAMSGVPANGTLYRFMPRKLLTSVSRLSPNAIKIYPNPASSHINVLLKENLSTAATATLYDMKAQKIMEYQVAAHSQSFQMPVAGLPNGIYELKLTANGATLVQTVTILH